MIYIVHRSMKFPFNVFELCSNEIIKANSMPQCAIANSSITNKLTGITSFKIDIPAKWKLKFIR